MAQMERTTASLRRRLVLQLALPLLVLFAVGGAITSWAARHYADGIYDRSQYDLAQSLADLVLPDLPRYHGRCLQDHVPGTSQRRARGIVFGGRDDAVMDQQLLARLAEQCGLWATGRD